MVLESYAEFPVWVAHDPASLERAIYNLVSNAVKYSSSGSHIRVILKVENAYAAIHVLDNGPGIHEAEHPHIFGRFYRGRETGEEGSGLGLAIVREIAAIHGGSISFTSKVGVGSHFVLRLPLASDTASAG